MNHWYITETTFDLKALHHKEAVYTIGNGYLGTRGAFEEGYPGAQPLTLVHGLFDDIPIVHTELVNAPDWLDLTILIDGERFRLDKGTVLDYHRDLDLQTGVLTRTVRWRSPGGYTVDLAFERFASLADEHVLSVRCRVTSVDFAGPLEFRAGIPGHMDNAGWVHWDWSDQGAVGERGAYLEVQTRGSRLTLCEACHLDVSGSGEITYAFQDCHWSPTVIARTVVEPGQSVTADKLATIFTARDTETPRQAALDKLTVAVGQGYPALRAANDEAWAVEWHASNIVIEGDDEADLSLRHSLFQLLIAVPRHDDRVSIAAKSLSGLGYRGHVFWDTEIFMLPFFIYTQPQLARNMLMYRYRTLPGARRKAAENGYEGAMYAWESADSGDETTPRWVPNPAGNDLVRIWCGDIELHITADVAYAVHTYWRVAGDDAFMRDYGAEIVLDTARFWGSRAEWNEDRGGYEINDVIGPDEYHDHVDNSVYTNRMARWNLEIALKILSWLRREDPEKAGALETRLDLSGERLAHWREVIEGLSIAYDPESGLLEQFDGFFDLKDVDLNDYEPRSISMQALLGIEETQEYQILKQPDVLMLLYLLESEYDSGTLKTNWEYYTPRTDLSYGSSLGPAIQAALAAYQGDPASAYRHFIHAARTDLQDARGNTADGIHAATNGGLWQAAVFGFAGVRLTDAGFAAKPHLPPGWKRLRFRLRNQGRAYIFDLRPAHIEIRGVIFDLDGVLTDSSELHYRGWQRLADEEGIPFDRQANERLRGVSRRESLLLLLNGRQIPEERMVEMMERKNRYYQELISTLAPDDVLPGAKELLAELRLAGIKIAIGSASKNASAVLERLDLAEYVDVVADGYSVERHKPDPDLFLYAAEQLGLDPAQCIVVEDAEAGVAAALAGGMWAVGLGPVERVGAAHAVFPSLMGVHRQDMLGSLTQSRVHAEDDGAS